MECDAKIPLANPVATPAAEPPPNSAAEPPPNSAAELPPNSAAEPPPNSAAEPPTNPAALLALAARRPVTLVGLMGAGKTTVGRRLAARLALPFVDADAEIELASGLSIAEIFERFGEPHFRDGERRVIARLIDGAPKVIATGGGAFIQPETRALILARTLAVWLDADIATLVERVRRRNTRPLLKDRDPGEVLSELAAIRNPIYAEAPIRIGSQAAPHGDTVDAIIAALAAANGGTAA